VAAVWKYMATPDKNAAAHPAIAVCTAGPAGPLSSAAKSARLPPTTTTNTLGMRKSRSRLTGFLA